MVFVVGSLGGDGVMQVESPGWDWCPYKRDPSEASAPFYHVRTQDEDSHLGTKRQVLTRQQVYGCLGEIPENEPLEGKVTLFLNFNTEYEISFKSFHQFIHQLARCKNAYLTVPTDT